MALVGESSISAVQSLQLEHDGPIKFPYGTNCFPTLAVGRVHNPKNQLSQINSLTTVGCSLEYPIAKIHHETIVVFAELHAFIMDETHNLFLKFRALHKRPNETCYLARPYVEWL